MFIKEETKKYFNKYQVEDVANSNLDYLFILESPHKAEIENGYPVAGSSGVEMTKFIYSRDCEDAFGKLVSDANNYKGVYNGLEQFGIVNISPAPMQKSALQNTKLSAAEEKVISILEKLRVNYQAKTHQDEEWNQVKKLIIENLGARLGYILESCEPEYLIPCGKIAQNYLELVTIQNDLKIKGQIISGIPHPSRNQWRHYDTMDNLKSILAADIYLK
ncbi:MAG: hypothetical protein ACQERJ_00310 [Bacillota bacterium]